MTMAQKLKVKNDAILDSSYGQGPVSDDGSLFRSVVVYYPYCDIVLKQHLKLNQTVVRIDPMQ